MKKITCKGNGIGKVWKNEIFDLSVVADKSKVFPDDPGRGTPAMVYITNDDGEITHSATLTCAMNEGELIGGGDVFEISDRAAKWLDAIEPEVDAFLYGETK
jgi:hypothetical protein